MLTYNSSLKNVTVHANIIFLNLSIFVSRILHGSFSRNIKTLLTEVPRALFELNVLHAVAICTC